MGKIAFLFPGQGSQSVGMGHDLFQQYPAARRVMEQFNQWVDPKLTDIMFNGPEETLKRTLYTQPAILSVSLATLTVFQEKSDCCPAYAAGHSLGEYGALYAAGVLDLESAAKLVKRRAELMENAPPGAMAAILGLTETQVEKAVLHVRSLEGGTIAVANYNTAQQSVISGDIKAVEAVCRYAKEELGATRTLILPVGGAFHSPLMEDAANAFGKTLAEFQFKDARFPVTTNVDAQLTTRAADFRQKLQDQIYSSVRWTDTISLMAREGVDTFVEIGPGKVLTGMIKRIYKEANLINIDDAASLEQAVTAVGEKVLA